VKLPPAQTNAEIHTLASMLTDTTTASTLLPSPLRRRRWPSACVYRRRAPPSCAPPSAPLTAAACSRASQRHVSARAALAKREGLPDCALVALCAPPPSIRDARRHAAACVQRRAARPLLHAVRRRDACGAWQRSRAHSKLARHAATRRRGSRTPARLRARGCLRGRVSSAAQRARSPATERVGHRGAPGALRADTATHLAARRQCHDLLLIQQGGSPPQRRGHGALRLCVDLALAVSSLTRALGDGAQAPRGARAAWAVAGA
jgi:hypothetical protein